MIQESESIPFTAKHPNERRFPLLAALLMSTRSSWATVLQIQVVKGESCSPRRRIAWPTSQKSEARRITVELKLISRIEPSVVRLKLLHEIQAAIKWLCPWPLGWEGGPLIRGLTSVLPHTEIAADRIYPSVIWGTLGFLHRGQSAPNIFQSQSLEDTIPVSVGPLTRKFL